MSAALSDTVRANRYAGTCDICGHAVAAMAGTLHRADGRWITRHRPAVWTGSPVSGRYVGGCPDGPAPEPEPRPEPAARPELPDVAAGRYAVASATGRNDLDYYRVDCPTDGRWAGYTFVKRVLGGQSDVPVRGREARDALARIAADADSGARYGQTIGRCYVCNRTLTDETSRALGIGPDCRTRHG